LLISESRNAELESSVSRLAGQPVLELQESEFNNRHSSFNWESASRGFQNADERKTIALSRSGRDFSVGWNWMENDDWWLL